MPLNLPLIPRKGMNTQSSIVTASPRPEILISEREAAKRMSISTKTLFNLRRAGRLAGVKIGARVLYSPDVLAEFAATRSTH